MPAQKEINEYSPLAVCFGERVGSESAQFGIYYFLEKIPQGCHILDTTVKVRLVECP